jgi:hypothetical protein
LRSLDSEEARLLCQRLLARYPLENGKDSDVVDLLAQVNMFFPGALAPLQPLLMAQRLFFPAYLYLGAAEGTSRQLLELLRVPSEISRSHLLQALAWIGSEPVQTQFAVFRLEPPDWRSELFVPPENYAQEAGWELTEDGRRRNLYFDTSFELIPSAVAESVQKMGAEPTADHERCGWCRRPLQPVLDLDLRDARCNWIAPEGERIRLVVCTNCSFYETTYMDITLTGEARWSHHNGEKSAFLKRISDDGEMLELPEPLCPGAARKTPFEAVGRLMLDERGASQLGGHPEWIDDAVYPPCPSCGQTMPFLAQVDFGDWMESEGIFYLFLCLHCKITAAHYQQT